MALVPFQTMSANDLFFEPYDREAVAFGSRASAELHSYVSQVRPQGLAIDLGAGAGRDTIALARSGLNVRSYDLSSRGLDRLMERAMRLGLGDRVELFPGDVREAELPRGEASVVVATTVLDHLPVADAKRLWQRMIEALCEVGVIYAEVHTTEDPGSPISPGRENAAPVSETAAAVVHYFAPGELLEWATRSGALRVLRYEERLEWDYTHGDEHQHGKAILLAVRSGVHPPWYGHPIAFPRNEDEL